MKKILSVLLSMLMLTAGAALAEETEAIDPIIGVIVEMREDGSFLVEQLEDGSQVHVLVDADTHEEADWAIGEGDVVLVSYDGRMTRSLPPQVTAQSIRSYSIEGIVSEVDSDNNRVLITSPQVGQVWATLPEHETAADYEGQEVRIYTNGIMALSLPGQVHALTIHTIFTETGKITEIDTDYFLMDWGESQLRVNFDEHTKVIESFDVGDEVQVFYNGIMARSMPGQITAVVIHKIDSIG